ncbi:MAG: 30S ribosomal protein S6 [Ignavibacteriae bacterium]|nr:30S ribosomal protein S6 [Ignavibacteriota bacterium]MCB0751017.1 30S ribosomal protein S6 [Ignavibacteriota bacterium]MCB9210103.1 30S ribosomal protein S6 [Ignavibacteriales bacterium]MCB9218512.1 30S ribosomal protein S6 [Ignavibacteriales bacterium]MCB9259482.1 30S ribosomal protein S6 [Ignavibacteriales bacterium]
MAINTYESVVIINAALEDPQVEQTVASIHENIKANGGEITDSEDWGRKRLAYAIQNAKSGYYYITRFNGSPSMITEFERILRLDENVIRYMTIALDKKALEYLKNAKKGQPESDEETGVQEESKKEVSNE